MSIRVHIPTPMRQYTENQAVVEAVGGTVKDLLDNLGKKYPGIVSRVFENGQVRRFVNVYVNDEDVRYLSQRENTILQDGDSISIVPSIAGGAPLR